MIKKYRDILKSKEEKSHRMNVYFHINARDTFTPSYLPYIDYGNYPLFFSFHTNSFYPSSFFNYHILPYRFVLDRFLDDITDNVFNVLYYGKSQYRVFPLCRYELGITVKGNPDLRNKILTLF